MNFWAAYHLWVATFSSVYSTFNIHVIAGETSSTITYRLYLCSFIFIIQQVTDKNGTVIYHVLLSTSGDNSVCINSKVAQLGLLG